MNNYDDVFLKESLLQRAQEARDLLNSLFTDVLQPFQQSNTIDKRIYQSIKEQTDKMAHEMASWKELEHLLNENEKQKLSKTVKEVEFYLQEIQLFFDEVVLINPDGPIVELKIFIEMLEKTCDHYNQVHRDYFLFTGSALNHKQKEKDILSIIEKIEDYINTSYLMVFTFDKEDDVDLCTRHIDKLIEVKMLFVDLLERIDQVQKQYKIVIQNLKKSHFGKILLKQKNINYKYKNLFNPTFLNHYFEKGEIEEKNVLLKGQLFSFSHDKLIDILAVRDEGVQVFNGFLQKDNFTQEELNIKKTDHIIAIIKILRKSSETQLIDWVEFIKINKDWTKHLKISPNKKTIPSYPQKIGFIVCDENSKAKKLQNNIQKKLPSSEMITFYVSTEKNDAVDKIANIIRKFNREKLVDVFVILKEKDNLENLWLFNSRKIIETLSKSKIPMISFISHERDYTLLDEVADFSAANYKEILALITEK
ncbi:exodeoxyribonuclease VII large subunit [Candidatus Phytoplasma pruni]|uniref:Exonuclease VII large subunit C-terminal domain-containing protein n=1 Tax=Candidatus Phytoplasma pruni TaxID=479893 RepID=A0A851HII1_9MOLU|nr:exodeoxyribonuclease VII large subunit [Candidatus Phytoplasma pruni]NWN45633.1 hypothetical protein [Candidatus Phytoplasma pruni]